MRSRSAEFERETSRTAGNGCGAGELFGLSEAFAFHRWPTGERDPLAKRIARRLGQQFARPEAIEAEFGYSPRFRWQIESSSVAEDRTAHKLLLNNAAGVRC